MGLTRSRHAETMQDLTPFLQFHPILCSLAFLTVPALMACPQWRGDNGDIYVSKHFQLKGCTSN